MKTSELTGAALDWAVAKCEGVNYRLKERDDLTIRIVLLRQIASEDLVARFKTEYYTPSTNWAQGGPIIEREKIIERDESFGPTMLIAAMRCYVASKLGDDVDIPKELS